MPDITRYDKLPRIAREINAHHEAAWSGAKIAKEKFDGSLNEALLCGQKLIDVKEEILPHGQFLTWLAEHCPRIAVRTCQRYMQLTRLVLNASHGKTHLTANGVRQAYLEMGIWKETDEATPAKALPETFGIPNTKPIDQGATAAPCPPQADPENVQNFAQIEARDAGQADQLTATHKLDTPQHSARLRAALDAFNALTDGEQDTFLKIAQAVEI